MTGDTIIGGTLPDQNIWAKAHDDFLETRLHLVRLQLDRHVLWMGAQREAGADAQLHATAFFGEDERAQPLTEAIAEHIAQVRSYEEELLRLGAPSGLTGVAAAAGLTEVERDALVLALAVELDASVANSCAFIHDDPTRPFVTPSLVAAVTQRPLSGTWDLLDPMSASQRFGFFTPDMSHGVLSKLALDGRMVNGLRGRNYIDPRLAEIVTPMPSLPLPRSLQDVVDQLLGWIERAAQDFAGGVVNLVGVRGQGRESAVALLANRLGMLPMNLSIERLAEHSDRVDILRLIEREALLLPGVSYVDAPDGVGDGPAVGAAFETVLNRLGGLVVVGSTQPIGHRVVALSIRLPKLDAEACVELWEQVLGDADPDDPESKSLGPLVQQFALGPEAVVQAVGEAEAAAALNPRSTERSRGGRSRPDFEELWTASRKFVGRELGELAQRIEPRAVWDQLVLPENELELLRSITRQVNLRATVYQEWGFADRTSSGLGISALFVGPPGTGKTMSAEIMADELSLDLYRIDLSSVVSKYIGETEKNLRRVFDAADQGGAILFFDEADALFGKRTEVKDSHDRHSNVEINYLLQRMEEYGGLSILATNRKADLDAAFLRRIRFLVSFPFPRPEYRRRIWETIFPHGVPLAPLDFAALAKLEIAGGNIRNVAMNAAFSAAGQQLPVGMKHIMEAAGHEYRKMDKMISAGEFGDYVGLVTP
jgi:hypothetical protein